LRQFRQPSLDAIRFEIREFLTIHSRRTLVRATLGIGMGQDVFTVNLVEQRVEMKASL